MIAAAIALLAGQAVAQTPQPSACEAPEHRQFDFWIGEWEVFDRTTGERAGHSLIERLYGGCVLRENWSSEGFEGGSLNAFWSGDGQWHQTWMDQAGAVRHFVGGLEGGRMTMTARQPVTTAQGGVRLVRLTFTANPDGTVRQHSDFSDDGGATWRLRYDFEYRPLR
ncbi:hypothetical protein Q0812_13590 [Brevundimonas sp. 2R-24]|uniref:DUF1579 domain-containing protein n=1 Tax=Peiella sedimenti TaxID=3061083 RepID=A0ABT8SPG6_9CAUL|nr:hypothetical protein [Caulobacteraceae bacterium XZ-24]